MRIFAPLGVTLLALFIAGCETMPAAQRIDFCQTVDWWKYGRNDGQLGVPLAERTQVFASCRRLGYPPDLDAYRAGRAEGLLEYCTAESGYHVGYSGRPYRDVCPPSLELMFLQGYEQGKRDRPVRYDRFWRYGTGLGHRIHRDYDRHRERDRHDRPDDADDSDDHEIPDDRDAGPAWRYGRDPDDEPDWRPKPDREAGPAWRYGRDGDDLPDRDEPERYEADRDDMLGQDEPDRDDEPVWEEPDRDDEPDWDQPDQDDDSDHDDDDDHEIPDDQDDEG